MTYITRILAFTLALIALPMAAQTRITTSNVSGSSSTSGRVWVVMPSGAIAEADLVGIVIDTSGSRPVLRAVPPPAPAVPVDKAVAITVTGDTRTFTLPESPAGESLHVFRNGLLMASPADYAVAADGKTVTFTDANTPRSADIVQLRYRVLQ